MKKDKKVAILNLVIIILAVVLVMTMFSAISATYDAVTDYSYSNEEDDFIWRLEYEDYADLVRYYYNNCGSNGKEEENLQEYYNLAKYFEAAFHHKIYEESGDTVRAEKYKAIMDEVAAELGEFAFVTEKIDEKLGF